MTTRAQIKASLLKQLLAHDGNPAPEAALNSGARLSLGEVPLADIGSVLAELEAAGLAAAHLDDVTEVKSWTLTAKGAHKAKQLR